MTTTLPATIEIDHDRGVIWVHVGPVTVLRVCQLPTPVPHDVQMDLTHMHGFSPTPCPFPWADLAKLAEPAGLPDARWLDLPPHARPADWQSVPFFTTTTPPPVYPVTDTTDPVCTHGNPWGGPCHYCNGFNRPHGYNANTNPMTEVLTDYCPVCSYYGIHDRDCPVDPLRATCTHQYAGGPTCVHCGQERPRPTVSGGN